jgi:hypothetical protein
LVLEELGSQNVNSCYQKCWHVSAVTSEGWLLKCQRLGKEHYENVVKVGLRLVQGVAMVCFTAPLRMSVTAVCMFQLASLASCLSIVNKLFYGLFLLMLYGSDKTSLF